MGGQSNVAAAVDDALNLWTKCRKAIYEVIVSAPISAIGEYRDNLIEQLRCDGDVGPYSELIFLLRGMRRTETRGRGRPEKMDSQPGTFTSPFLITEWTSFQKHVGKVVNRLSQSGSVYHISKSLHELCSSEDLRIYCHITSRPATGETVKEESPSDWLEISDLELLARLEKWARDQIDVLSQMGVKTEGFAVAQSNFWTFSESLEAGLRSVEESLKSYDRTAEVNSTTLSEFHSMKELNWGEVTISVVGEDVDPLISIAARGTTVENKASQLGLFTVQGHPAIRLIILTRFSRANGFIAWPESKPTRPTEKYLEDEENDNFSEQVGVDGSDSDGWGAPFGGNAEQKRVAAVKAPVEKHQVSELRRYLKNLLGVDDDPFYPYHKPAGETVERRPPEDERKSLPHRQSKGYKLKCTCCLETLVGPKNSADR